MFEAWKVAKGRKVQGGRILSQGTVCSKPGCVSSIPSSFMVLDDSKIWTVFDFLVIGLPYVAR